MFKREPKYIFMEVEKGSKLPEINPELREMLKTLSFNPAFNYLVQKLRVSKALVEHQLKEGFELSDTQLRYLQAGIFWLSFLEREIKLATQSPAPQREADSGEISELSKLQEHMDLVGVE